MNVSFFDVTDGIDQTIVELLNMKMGELNIKFNAQMEDKIKTISYLNETINKYKKLAPKSKKSSNSNQISLYFRFQNPGNAIVRYLELSLYNGKRSFQGLGLLG